MALTKPLQTLVDAAQANIPLTPGQLGKLVDAAKNVELERRVADKLAALVKADEVLLKLAVMAALKQQDVRGGAGKEYATTLKTEDQPTVKDWTKFYEYIVANDALDMLERRPSKVAIKARWDDGKSVPGVDKFPVDKLLFSKLKV